MHVFREHTRKPVDGSLVLGRPMTGHETALMWPRQLERVIKKIYPEGEVESGKGNDNNTLYINAVCLSLIYHK